MTLERKNCGVNKMWKMLATTGMCCINTLQISKNTASGGTLMPSAARTIGLTLMCSQVLTFGHGRWTRHCFCMIQSRHSLPSRVLMKLQEDHDCKFVCDSRISFFQISNLESHNLHSTNIATYSMVMKPGVLMPHSHGLTYYIIIKSPTSL